MHVIRRNILLNPGPATTTDSVKRAQVVPDICPREAEFGDLLASITRDITRIAGDERTYATVLFSGSGTSATEAVISSIMPPGKKILIIDNGAYGRRMIEIAEAYGIACVPLVYSWEGIPSARDVEACLASDPEIWAVAVVHHETTTGLLNPIEAIGKVARAYDKVFVVDAISSFAGIPVDLEASCIDFLVASSNKCLQGMAGISFVVSRRTRLDALRELPRRSYYLSLYDQFAFMERERQMRFTAPVQTFYALRQALDELALEGLAQRFERYECNWRALRRGVEALGFQVLTEAAHESRLLITLVYPASPLFDFDRLHDALYQQGFTIYPGKLGRKETFRLACMGAIDEGDIHAFLAAFHDVLLSQGVLPFEHVGEAKSG